MQISPDDYDTYTEVIYLDENMTLKEAYEKVSKDFKHKINKFHCEIHFEINDTK